MIKFQTFIELLVTQTCRRAAHEYEVYNKNGPKTPKKKNSIWASKTGRYSLEFLKELHDKPREFIYKLLKVPENPKLKPILKAPSTLHWVNNPCEFGKAEREKLMEFLGTIKEVAPPKSKKWIELQHYLQYVYRNFANPKPDPSSETLSPYFIKKLRNLVKELIEDDESQLYLRIVALLREYCIFAQWNYSKGGNHAITKLFYYYEAMLSAAKNCSAAFQEFEVIVYKNYSVCWIDFNTCVFIRYFFETDYVQLTIYKCLEFKESPGDTPAMFGLLEDLKNLWIKEQKRIMKINEEAQVDDTTDFYYIEEAMINCHKKVLKSNCWIFRSQQELEDLDLRRLDHHIFRLLFDPFFHPDGPILDKNGQCICEECLFAKYKLLVDKPADEINNKILKDATRQSFCRECQKPIDLNTYHAHVNKHCCEDDEYDPAEMLSNEMSLLSLNSNNSGPPALPNGFAEKMTEEEKEEEEEDEDACEIHFKHFEEHTEAETTMEAFEEYLRQRKEGKCQLLSKNVRNFIKIKKDIFTNSNGQVTEKVFDMFNPTSQNVPAVPKPVEPEASKIKEMGKNAHKCERPYTACKPVPGKDAASICEHNCRLDNKTPEIKPNNACHSHGGPCEHGKDAKKCDCTYCEVFGSNVTSHVHKNNELRDRLRIRLHQRREKRTKDTSKHGLHAAEKSANNCAAAINSAKLKTVISKVEERVPLPSSPTNIPPAPVVKPLDLTFTVSEEDDIHGLVNYIEGNSVLNKIELAQKKAAKKIRQRQKKEEERQRAEEQKRLEEELKRKEAERREAAKRKVEREKAEAAAIAKAKAEKCKSKKERQAEKRQELKKQQKDAEKEKENIKNATASKNTKIVEETIPAMVTIKRIAENENGEPTVTITLKGSTPDQDKLLYTLVGGPDDKIDAPKEPEKNSKKKKKQKNALSVVTKDVKVTVALDPTKTKSEPDANTRKLNKNNHVKMLPNAGKQKMNDFNKKANTPSTKKEIPLSDLNIPMLRLPPGITITKIEGPVSNRNYKVGNIDEERGGPTINVGKSGVIVVDTEKLIQSKPLNGESKAKNKKKKKKNAKKAAESENQSTVDGKKMITLKNPIFQSMQSKPSDSAADKHSDNVPPAAIFTNENGMVTIRSSRLMNGPGSALNPMPVQNIMPEIEPYQSHQGYTSTPEEKEISSFNAREILSGLPGIEITKVDKKQNKTEADGNKACQTAEVSIIPTSNGSEKFDFEKDDWFYESVFSPRDVLEDDMDAEELELEAFKRFCQQSIPPPQKEKVAHLNVAEIVFKKQADNTV
ncbi:unnamed protein product [Acanthoscelides obtectus]|uniref:FAM193 C-terminal domain-containing protein n=1 Tax=Acanthoscelides obtectus TaxID=200917 RepID=A0A9P0NR29_ACAOB|nr:unnamed protein product [Acanthoscelides obtectus]CAK1628890.1 hypothetical protein AOBTE_LOCUS5453 [Acanthoscelides obtectus]